MLEHIFPSLNGKINRGNCFFMGLMIGFFIMCILFVCMQQSEQTACAKKGHSYQLICSECGDIEQIDQEIIKQWLDQGY